MLGVCGTAWQAAYSSAHAAWSQDGRTARALVFEVRGTSGGLADRLTGMMTALLLAILTDRAFQLDWPEHTTALRTPHIDATGLLPALGRAPPAEVRRVTWINGDRLKLAQLTATDELDRLWPERVVRMQSNRGFTQALLVQHAAAAARRQLSPNSTQFGCLLNFLLAPTPATLSPYAALAARLTDAANQGPVVGVHVRTGDRAFDGAARLQAQGAEERAEERAALERAEDKLYESHRFIVDFAMARTAALPPHPPHPPRLLLLSDSVALRRAAVRQLGEVRAQPITLTPTLPPNPKPNPSSNPKPYPNSDQAVLNPPAADLAIGHIARGGGRDALSTAVAEHWLYSTATEFVYSSH